MVSMFFSFVSCAQDIEEGEFYAEEKSVAQETFTTETITNEQEQNEDEVKEEPIVLKETLVRSIDFETDEGFKDTWSYRGERTVEGTESRWSLCNGNVSTTRAISGKQSMLIRSYGTKNSKLQLAGIAKSSKFNIKGLCGVEFSMVKTGGTKNDSSYVCVICRAGDEKIAKETYILSNTVETYKIPLEETDKLSIEFDFYSGCKSEDCVIDNIKLYAMQ